MHLEIITPDKELYSGEVTSIVVPGKEGSFGIMNNHAPIISTLKAGKIKVTDTQKNTQQFEIKGGVVEVSKNKVSVLAQ
jgi:F-type H+-transporting ATPase subunit epsilon